MSKCLSGYFPVRLQGPAEGMASVDRLAADSELCVCVEL